MSAHSFVLDIIKYLLVKAVMALVAFSTAAAFSDSVNSFTEAYRARLGGADLGDVELGTNASQPTNSIIRRLARDQNIFIVLTERVIHCIHDQWNTAGFTVHRNHCQYRFFELCYYCVYS